MGYVEEVCIVALLSVYICLADDQQTAAYNISVMIPKFTENEVATVVCKVNNSELNDVNCPSSVLPITRLKIILSNDSSSTPLLTGTDMCVFSSFLTCTHGPPVSALECGCYHDGGDIYTVNVTVRADKATHENKTIDCRPNCINENSQYGLMNTVTGEPIVFEIPTTTTIITTRSTTLQTSNVSSSSVTNITITSGTTDHSSSGATDHLTSAPPCNDNCTPSSKCPDWCIAVSVCVPVGGVVIITVTVIIIKKKKAKTPGSSVQDTKEMQDRTKHLGTENRPTPAQGGNNRTEERHTPAQGGNNQTEERHTPAQSGNNRTEESVQDTKEMQDRSKHLGTDNSPEREKRRKKKKKKKTFQEVDGESVSRENKSTVNDHKAAQKSPNDNSVSVNENSPVTYNGELRRLPMPNIPHMTSVERNSTYFQSETPRKLPPLQPKAMIIP